MKKLWSLRKNDHAVSPVIATILMVAITVVLAAVLYVMVLGFSGGTGTAIVISMDEGSTTTNYTFAVLGIQGVDGALSLQDVYIIAYDEDGAVALSETQVYTMRAGGNYSGVFYIEATETPATAESLEVGDKFHLQRAMFDQGSEFTLTDGAGSTYGTYVV